MDYANEFPVKTMCFVFKVSRSGYYKWRSNKAFYHAKNEVLNDQIKTIFESSRRTYGSPRVLVELNKMNIEISESTVARRMKSLKITPRTKKRYKNTTDSKHNLKVSPNVLNREFTVEKTGRVWVSDITYIRLKYSFVYLTTVIDLADRMVVGWSLMNILS